MKRVFVSHRFSSNPAVNADAVGVLARRVALDGDLPFAPQVYFPQFLDEATERDLALTLCLALVALSDEVRVYGKLSAGMKLEIAEALRLGIPVVDGESGEVWRPNENRPSTTPERW